eukprot:CAMPEP_0174370404 /NCGR_PEP_ID=MMETSP0811_2-20130205/96038_1 /TAXON_ID=73025 ORGANISM="Eutreptiella gymnastica-like, Strain CCMP1594" /NCGR_SAMPLE_ID=MMETSP0811_2 /ASSEMBLY_ACC=CAM_ASM_000667 /LENGTH=61 /DNA_ID=CAMNT_0015515797 /DNA_START=298 /DNA_END=483 /DNA_ORIENTATION=-
MILGGLCKEGKGGRKMLGMEKRPCGLDMDGNRETSGLSGNVQKSPDCVKIAGGGIITGDEK